MEQNKLSNKRGGEREMMNKLLIKISNVIFIATSRDFTKDINSLNWTDINEIQLLKLRLAVHYSFYLIHFQTFVASSSKVTPQFQQL